jgi:hypothetical protein
MAATIEEVKKYLSTEAENHHLSAEHYEILAMKKDDYMSVYIAKGVAFRNTARVLEQALEFAEGTLDVSAKPVLSGTEVKGE